MKEWYVYLVRCVDGSLYGGVTTDLERRVFEHNQNNKKGAKYTRARRPVTLVYSEVHADRSSASQREYQVKKWPKHKKEALVLSQHA